VKLRDEGQASTILEFSDPSYLIYRLESSYIQQNSYCLIERATRSAVVIDCGFGAFNALLRLFESESAELVLIALTHEHYDHIRNLNELRTAFPMVPVAASKESSSALPDIKKNLSAFHELGGYSAEVAEIEITETRQVLTWGKSELKSLKTPGHTPGSICYFFAEHVFTGDTLIKATPTVTNLPGGSRADLTSSLDRLFQEMPIDKTFYTGHGEKVLARDTGAEVHLAKRTGLKRI
jgi:hydroxyacylglutathione hydrolase